MSDKILIQDLLIRGIIGIHDWEREKKQDILINIVMEADCQPAGVSDDFRDAVDYRAVTKKVLALVEGSTYFLVERLAEEVAKICLEDERVVLARVRVEKPGAVRFSRSVGIEIERFRDS